MGELRVVTELPAGSRCTLIVWPGFARAAGVGRLVVVVDVVVDVVVVLVDVDVDEVKELLVGVATGGAGRAVVVLLLPVVAVVVVTGGAAATAASVLLLCRFPKVPLVFA